MFISESFMGFERDIFEVLEGDNILQLSVGVPKISLESIVKVSVYTMPGTANGTVITNYIIIIIINYVTLPLTN